MCNDLESGTALSTGDDPPVSVKQKRAQRRKQRKFDHKAAASIDSAINMSDTNADDNDNDAIHGKAFSDNAAELVCIAVTDGVNGR